MKNRRLARFVFGSLVALLPVFSSGGPWNPNRARPPGFQRTLGYLEGDLYDYPDTTLQQTRNKILHDDLLTVLIPQLKGSFPPSTWEAEGQKAYDVYAAKYEQMKALARQTMSDPEGLIQAVENNQPIPAELLPHPNTQALVLLKWQLLNLEEQTYQAVLYANGAVSGGGGNPPPPPKVSPPEPGKSKSRIDWERKRDARRRAIERRRAWEERQAAEAQRRLDELLELIRYLQNHGSLSANKFNANRPGAGSIGSGGLAEPESPASEPAASAPAETSAPPIEEIEELGDQMEQLVETMEPAEKESAKAEPAKVKVYRGTLIFHRPPNLDDAAWQKVKESVVAAHAHSPELTDMEDKGDEVRWRYKMLIPPKGSEWMEIVPDGEPTEEDADGKTAPEKEEPKVAGNGDADPIDDKVIPGTEQKPEARQVKAKVAAKPVSAKPEPAKPAAPKSAAPKHDGYWFDPTDESRDDDDPYIYVRVDGTAKRVLLSKAPALYGIPDHLTIDQMSWYNESLHRVVKNSHTHERNLKR
jgi:hypothetical protein